MSDNWMQLVPTDPQYRPVPKHAELARQLLSAFVPHADNVSAESKERIVFFHPGSNWSGVECPNCGADAEPWWEEALDVAEANGFSNLMCTAGCCGTEVSLNELRYIWPAAFGSFVLVAMNPKIENLSAAQRSELEKQLGCSLRVVWTHL